LPAARSEEKMNGTAACPSARPRARPGHAADPTIEPQRQTSAAYHCLARAQPPPPSCNRISSSHHAAPRRICRQQPRARRRPHVRCARRLQPPRQCHRAVSLPRDRRVTRRSRPWRHPHADGGAGGVGGVGQPASTRHAPLPR